MEEVEDQENVPNFYQKKNKKQELDFVQVLDYIDKQPSETNVIRNFKPYFDEWYNYLEHGFNLMLRGHGSKIALVNQFLKDKKFDQKHYLEFNGHEIGNSIAFILTQMIEWIGDLKKPTGVMEHAKSIARDLTDSKKHLLLVIHNIDSPVLRGEQTLEILTELCKSRNFHMIVTLAFPTGDIYWKPDSKYLTNLLEYTTNTYFLDMDEFFALNPNLETQSQNNGDSGHTMKSLDMIWVSLASNTQNIFLKLYELLMTTGESVSFFDLLTSARSQFYTTSEAVLHNQLVELKDHYLIHVADDNQISIPLKSTLAASFVESKMGSK